jgi:formylglycine-generating enzyme required for sulfatase activity
MLIVQSALLLSFKKEDAGTRVTPNTPNNPANLPTLSTSAASEITSTTASSVGNISSDGGSDITARGVVWSSSQKPTIELNTKTSDGTGSSSFNSSLTGLSPNTLYYVRAYATNAVGTAYGNQISFSTQDGISLNIETSLIPAGTFTMGSPITEPDRTKTEIQHQVTLSAFRMSKYEISNAQYAGFLNAKGIGSNGIYAAGAYPTQALIYSNIAWGLTWTGMQWQPVAGKENFPIENVTWYGAAEFAIYAGGRLPTEAEWEYACRGNTTTPFSTGACLDNTQANYRWDLPLTGCTNTSDDYPDQTLAVNSYSPNAYGLYNMHGNVCEWCADWYGVYSTTAQTNPSGPASGTYRILRGGSGSENARSCRSAMRGISLPAKIHYDCGFRLAFAP